MSLGINDKVIWFDFDKLWNKNIAHVQMTTQSQSAIRHNLASKLN